MRPRDASDDAVTHRRQSRRRDRHLIIDSQRRRLCHNPLLGRSTNQGRFLIRPFRVDSNFGRGTFTWPHLILPPFLRARLVRAVFSSVLLPRIKHLLL